VRAAVQHSEVDSEHPQNEQIEKNPEEEQENQVSGLRKILIVG